jgi:hypothetical protein
MSIAESLDYWLYLERWYSYRPTVLRSYNAPTGAPALPGLFMIPRMSILALPEVDAPTAMQKSFTGQE